MAAPWTGIKSAVQPAPDFPGRALRRIFPAAPLAGGVLGETKDLDSYIVLIPFVSAYLLNIERGSLMRGYFPAPVWAGVSAIAGLAALAAGWHWKQSLSENDSLTFFALGFVCFIILGGFVFLGRRVMAAAATFHCGFLFFLAHRRVVSWTHWRQLPSWHPRMRRHFSSVSWGPVAGRNRFPDSGHYDPCGAGMQRHSLGSDTIIATSPHCVPSRPAELLAARHPADICNRIGRHPQWIPHCDHRLALRSHRPADDRQPHPSPWRPNLSSCRLFHCSYSCGRSARGRERGSPGAVSGPDPPVR